MSRELKDGRDSVIWIFGGTEFQVQAAAGTKAHILAYCRALRSQNTRNNSETRAKCWREKVAQVRGAVCWEGVWPDQPCRAL
jgi:hypothetical protein